MTSRNSLGALLMCLSMLGFALMDTLSKIMVQSYPIAQTLWIRYVIYTLFALAIARLKGLRRMAVSRRPWLQASRSLIALVENGVFVLAFAYLPLADAHSIAATSPLIVIVLAVPLLREPVRIHRWLAVLAGFVGVLVIVRPGFTSFHWPLLIALAGAFLWGLYQIMVRLCARDDAPETTLLWSAIVGLVAVTVIAPIGWRSADATAWMMLFAIGLLGSLAHYGLIRALDYADASAMQPYSYSLLVWAALLGFLVFGDIPAIWTILGAAIVVSSGLYTWYHDRNQGAADAS